MAGTNNMVRPGDSAATVAAIQQLGLGNGGASPLDGKVARLEMDLRTMQARLERQLAELNRMMAGLTTTMVAQTASGDEPFYRKLAIPEIPARPCVANGTEDKQLLVWDAAASRWMPTTPEETGVVEIDPETATADGDVAVWDEENQRWNRVATTQQLVVIDVDWDGETLRQQRQMVRVLPVGDPAEYATIVGSELCE